MNKLSNENKFPKFFLIIKKYFNLYKINKGKLLLEVKGIIKSSLLSLVPLIFFKEKKIHKYF